DALRQRRGNTVGIDGFVVQSLGLQENLMPVALGKPNHLVFNRRTVTRADAVDLPRIHRRQMQVLTDDRMRRRGGRSYVAIALRRADSLCQEGKGWRRNITWLGLKPSPVDGPAIKAGRCSG